VFENSGNESYGFIPLIKDGGSYVVFLRREFVRLQAWMVVGCGFSETILQTVDRRESFREKYGYPKSYAWGRSVLMLNFRGWGSQPRNFTEKRWNYRLRGVHPKIFRGVNGNLDSRGEQGTS